MQALQGHLVEVGLLRAEQQRVRDQQAAALQPRDRVRPQARLAVVLPVRAWCAVCCRADARGPLHSFALAV